jgi:hypothetical protein
MVIAVHLGLRVSRLVADGFLASRSGREPRRRSGHGVPAVRRSLRWVVAYHDTLPPLEDFLEYREPFLRVVPMVVWVEDAEDRHWIAVWRDWIALDGKWEKIGDAPAGNGGSGRCGG